MSTGQPTQIEYALHSFPTKKGMRPNVILAHAEYGAIRDAKAGLSEIIAVESKLDGAMENYVELEETVLGLSLRSLAFTERSHQAFQLMREQVSRRMLNYLASVKLYQDSLRAHSKRVLSDADAKSVRADLKDGPHQPMEYRIASVLRDFTQHEDHALSSLEVLQGWDLTYGLDDAIEKDRAYYVVVPKMDGTRLAKRNGLAPDVKAALETLGKKADVLILVRKHVEHLGTIHAEFRKLAKEQSEAWEATLRGAMDRYLAALEKGDKAPPVIFAGPINVAMKDPAQIQLFTEFLETRDYLVRKNYSHVNFSRRYVSSERPPDRPIRRRT